MDRGDAADTGKQTESRNRNQSLEQTHVSIVVENINNNVSNPQRINYITNIVDTISSSSV